MILNTLKEKIRPNWYGPIGRLNWTSAPYGALISWKIFMGVCVFELGYIWETSGPRGPAREGGPGVLRGA